jgi:hypothetical protein
MRLNWILGLLLGVVLNIPASAQISVYVGSAPPRVRYERRGPLPGPGYIWVGGYWAPNGHHYRWVAGGWQRPPYEGARWSNPHYVHQRQGWQLQEGHWDRDDRSRGQGHAHEGGGNEHGH